MNILSETTFKILSYNINGLKNKCLYPEFFEYIGGFDMFALIETHVMETQTENWSKYFKDFNLMWQKAERSSIHGRASGGIVCGVRKDLQTKGVDYSFVKENHLNMIKISTLESCFTFVPVYIRGENWACDFEAMREIFEKIDDGHIILAGDVNVRIGNLQQNLESGLETEFTAGMETRRSKDSIVNAKGKQYMEFCEDNGLLILNGRTEGDEEGHYTYVSKNGSSVNDLAAISYYGLKMIKKFEVEEKVWSDHFPLKIEIKLNKIDINAKPLNLPPKLIWKKATTERYQNSLNQNLLLAINGNGIDNLSDLSNLIQKSVVITNKQNTCNKYKADWYNSRCERARKKSFECLNKFRRSSTLQDKETYLNAVKTYKKTCKERKLEYARELEAKICNTTDVKQWWILAKQIRGQKHKIGSSISAEDFKIYFNMLLNKPQFANNIEYAVLKRTNIELDREIDVREIQDVLNETKENKAPGMDRVPYEFLKYSSHQFLTELARQYNRIYESGQLDNIMQESVIFPIYKKGDINTPSNYRGISFMNTMAKIFMGIVNNRLKKWISDYNILKEFQAGFRPGYSTVDNVYNLASIVHCKLSERKKVYAFFVDFSAAFDMVPRQLLIYKLHEIGISTKMVYLIQNIYQNTKSVVWTGDNVSQHFNTYTGVRQGCLLSPLLFTLYLNDIHDWLEGGLVLDEINIRVLLYADDIVILADDIEVFRKMIWNLENYCSRWNMVVNLQKSKIMVFRNGGRLSSRERWKYLNEEIEVVNEYCYLGVLLTPKMSFTKHAEQRNKRAKICINAAWENLINNSNVSLISKWKIFQSVCKTTQSYAAQVWGYNWFEEVDELQRYFLKKVLKQPKHIPNYILSLETDVPDNHFYTLKLHMDYIYKTLFLYDNNRLPHKLSIKIWNKQIFWALALKSWSESTNVPIENLFRTAQDWSTTTTILVNNLKRKSYTEKIDRARASESRFYRFLNPEIGIEYMQDVWKLDKIAIIMKTRADVLPLNGNVFRNAARHQCTLCNLREVENLQHFIARCPVLQEFRVRHFGTAYLDDVQLIQILNGTFYCGWDGLYNYVSNALRYRNYINREQF